MKERIINQIDEASKLIADALNVLNQAKQDVDSPEIMGKSTKVAIVVGHSKDRQGAANPDTGMAEYTFNYKVAQDIVSRLNNDESHSVEGVVVLRETTLRELPGKVNATGAVLCLSLHCNAFNRTARGCETLYYHTSKGGLAFAKTVQHELMELLNTKDRGIKPKSSEDRGGYMLRETNMPCVIAEPFFIDEDQDYNMGMQYREDGQLAEAYTNAILNMIENML